MFVSNSFTAFYVPTCNSQLLSFYFIRYFIACAEPGKRQLFRTGDLENKRPAECLTCFEDTSNSTNSSSVSNAGIPSGSTSTVKTTDTNSTSEEILKFPRCSYAKAHFNSLHNPKYYILDCLGKYKGRLIIVSLDTTKTMYFLSYN